MKSGQLILRIIIIVATICQILRLNAPNSILYSVPPDIVAGFKGLTSKGRERKG